MTESNQSPTFLQPGLHRPVYLWGGPGTIRMNRLKFMNAGVDEAVHLEAHGPTGAQKIVTEAGCNWIYLMYDWGFPPETEQVDWDSFSEAVNHYHALGARVFAYIQTSNCVYQGSFTEKDWYALNPAGQKIYYYTGRYMTCWTNPEWHDHLKDLISGAIQRGADGIFFDNPWHAAQPTALLDTWLGPAGCFCPRCLQKYRSQMNREIPIHLEPGQVETDSYIRWRAAQVTQTLASLSGYAKNIDSHVMVSANDFDAVMRPSYLIYGIDLRALAGVQDIIMIEDYGLPSYDDGTSNKGRARLVNNAITLRTALALAGDTPVSVDPYDKGIGFDSVYPSRRFQQAMAEAAACGASIVIKGTEFVDENGVFTLLNAQPYEPQRRSIGVYHRWLEEHAGLYQNRSNLAPVALLHPGDRLWQNWLDLSRLYFGAAQVLTAAGIPWKVITSPSQASSLSNVFVFGERYIFPEGTTIVDVTQLTPWKLKPQHGLDQFPGLKRWVESGVHFLYNKYFSSKLTRSLLDAIGIMRLFTRSPWFDLPNAEQTESILYHLLDPVFPEVRSTEPVLIEIWQQGSSIQVHLVNYSAQPQNVTISFPRPVKARLVSPDRPDIQEFNRQEISVDLDIYSVLLLQS